MVVEEGIDFSSCIAEGQVNKTKSIFYVFLFSIELLIGHDSFCIISTSTIF